MKFTSSRRPGNPWMVWLMLALTVLAAGCSSTDNPMSETTDQPLDGTRWQVAHVGGESVPSGQPGQTPHMILDTANGKVSGYGGVNRFGGDLEMDGSGKLAFRVFSTRRAGPPAQMALEVALFQALEAARSYGIRGNTLELLDAGDRTVARFTAVPAP